MSARTIEDTIAFCAAGDALQIACERADAVYFAAYYPALRAALAALAPGAATSPAYEAADRAGTAARLASPEHQAHVEATRAHAALAPSTCA